MSQPKAKYCCPKCESEISSAEKIRLKTLRMNGNQGELFLSVNPGDFYYDHEPAALFEKGENVRLLCPCCEEDLKSNRFAGFSKLIYCKKDEKHQEVFISNEAGKRKLYVLSDSGLEAYMEK